MEFFPSHAENKSDIAFTNYLIFLIEEYCTNFFTRIRIPFLKRRIMSNNEIIDMSERYQEVSSQFQKSLIRDILHKKDDKIILSGSTQNHIKQLEKIIKKFQE